MKFNYLNSERRGISICFLFLFIFVILKLIRNTVNYSSDINGGIWNIIVVLFVCTGLLYAFLNRSVIRHTPIMVGVLLAFFVFVNALIQMQSIDINSIYYVLVSSFYVFVMILFYNMPLKNGDIRQNLIVGFCIIIVQLFLLVTYVKYFSIYQYYQSRDHISLDNVYYGICLLPFILKYRSKLTMLNILLLFMNVSIASKRAGFIAVVLSMLSFFWIITKNRKNISKKIQIVFIGIILLFVLITIFQYINSLFNLGFIDRLFNLINDGGSGRTVIYLTVWNEYTASKLLDQLVGHGLTSILYMQSISISSAHNDLLNILYESGIIPVLLYIIFVISLVVQGIKMKRENYHFAAVYVSSLPICLVLTLFTSFFCSASCSVILTAYWGMELRDFEVFLKGRRRNVNYT